MDEKLNINLEETNEGDQEKVNAEVGKLTKQVEENIEEEKKELTEEEKKEIYIKELKRSVLERCAPKKHYGVAYHKKRNSKNKATKKSRSINRKR